MLEGADPIADDEELYRRIPVSQNWYDPSLDPAPSHRAFRPLLYDRTGLSVTRAKHTTPEEEAETGKGNKYFIAVLRAGTLRNHGVDVVPSPEARNPGHAELPGLRYEKRKQTEDLQLLLAHRLCVRIEGPYPE